MTLRTEAKGRACYVRLPIRSAHDPATVVLAHIRAPGDGIGTKPPDVCGVPACFDCHNVLDGRVPRPPGMSRDDVELAARRGRDRWLRDLAGEGWAYAKAKA